MIWGLNTDTIKRRQQERLQEQIILYIDRHHIIMETDQALCWLYESGFDDINFALAPKSIYFLVESGDVKFFETWIWKLG